MIGDETMPLRPHSRGLLRGEGERDHQVSSMELFFDLVYVFAITQLSHLLSERLDLRGATQTALLLLALWWAWVDTAWLAGGLASGPSRTIFWVAAVAMDSLGPATGFVTPGLGRSITRDWNISAEHMAERLKLFLIIALGESILVTGGTFAQLDITPATLAAFVVAFLGSVALWWVYFDLSFDAAEQAFASSSDPGRLGRFAYTYLHIPMVAGVIVTAVGDELVIVHPFEHASLATMATV